MRVRMNIARKFRDLLIILMILLCVLFAFELLVRIKFKYFPSKAYIAEQNRPKEECGDNFVKYGYCPGYKTIHNVSKENQKYQKVEIFIDQLGGRLPAKTYELNPEKSEVFIIGDSFIKASYIPYELTVYGILNSESIPTYALGYSSWNPIQYRGAIKKLGVPFGQYHVFLFTNDFLPSYSRSVVGEIRGMRWGAIHGPWKTLLKSSRLLWTLYWKIVSFKQTHFPKPEYIGPTAWDLASGNNMMTRENYLQCDDVSSSWNGTIMADYIQFSKNHSCWETSVKEAVDLSISEIKKIEALVQELDGTVIFYLVPAGWAFKYQNTIGRLSSAQYGIPNEVTLTQFGLTQYLEEHDIDLIDLEEILQRHLTKMSNVCGACENLLYLPIDGHWTTKTHEIIAELIASEVISRSKGE